MRLLPETPVPLNVVLVVAVDLSAALLSVQLPLLPVTQLPEPPTEKLPATVALATAAPVLTSRTVTAAMAFQLPPDLVALPLMDL